MVVIYGVDAFVHLFIRRVQRQQPNGADDLRDVRPRQVAGFASQSNVPSANSKAIANSQRAWVGCLWVGVRLVASPVYNYVGTHGDK